MVCSTIIVSHITNSITVYNYRICAALIQKHVKTLKPYIFVKTKNAISWECVRKCIFNMTVNHYVKYGASKMLIYEIWFPWLINTSVTQG
jgi:hypothetical protein